ncbi:hypothetical protein [Isoptericola sp. NPDC019482]|uniref:hypothetical protein n=1 Tax=Isoptericola sp. NPDC019482 TaxID=3154688 RepID=UPI00348905A4
MEIIYGGTSLSIADSENIGLFQKRVNEILARGGGWMTLAGTDAKTGLPGVTGILITPGVPILFRGAGTPDDAGVDYQEIQTN